MNTNTKKILFIVLFALDMALTVTLFVISILLLANMPTSKPTQVTDMISFFLVNDWAFFGIVVVPLILLLILNVIILFRYLKKSSAKKQRKLEDLSEEEKEELRRELYADMNKQNNNQE